jgi:hypothetical protein
MRRAASLTAALVLALSLVGEARAASLPFSGTLTLEIGSLPPIVVSGSGTAGLNGLGGLGHLASLQLAGGTFATSTTFAITDPDAAPLSGLGLVLANGPASFVFGGFTLDGKMALPGQATVCLFAACDGGPPANLNIPFTQGGTRGVGLGGAPITVKGLVNVSVTGAPWTSGTVFAYPLFLTRMGFVHGPASGGASSAANASGVVQLVTPIRIETNIAADNILPAFATLNLQFVPEPATLLLASLGALGLGVLGRRRTSRASASGVEPRQGR